MDYPYESFNYSLLVYSCSPLRVVPSQFEQFRKRVVALLFVIIIFANKSVSDEDFIC